MTEVARCTVLMRQGNIATPCGQVLLCGRCPVHPGSRDQSRYSPTDKPELGSSLSVASHAFTRAVLEREISGALKSCIDAHGPITRDTTASAAKRVISALKARGLWREAGEPDG